MDQEQKKNFGERLKRISKGGANTTAQVYVGPVEEAKVRRQADAGDLSSSMQYPLWIIGAVILGAGSVVLSRLVRFQVTGGALAGENSDLLMIVDGVVALTFVIAFRSMLGVNGLSMKLAKIVGVVAMIGLMHSLVHEAPGAFAKVFSPVWVNEVIATTKPRSVLFLRGGFVTSEFQHGKSAGLLADLQID
ncbi:MAG: hypothetical protein KUG58_08075 [Marinosulfonomonas sp.]|nr:hypothetical protein [Marinosulfonomonas sp.]